MPVEKRDAIQEVLSVEKELIEATQFVPEKRYRKRQDYLGALMRAVCELSDPEFDKLSDPAADWSCRAVDAFKAGNDLPDFETDEPHHSASTEPSNAEDVEYVEVAKIEASEVTEEVTEEVAEEINEIKSKKKPGRPKSKAKTTKPKVIKAREPVREPKVRVNGTNKWGVLNGSKSDLVCQMLARENGATMEEIKAATGHYHYNLCQRLRRHGFTLEKNGLRIRLLDKQLSA